MTKLSKWARVWIGVLLAIGVFELLAQLSKDPKPRTLSELLAVWFPKRWRRVLLTGLLALLTWHLWTQAAIQTPIPMTETPCCF